MFQDMWRDQFSAYKISPLFFEDFDFDRVHFILQLYPFSSDEIFLYTTPSYLRDKLPSNRRLLYRWKNSNTFHEIRCNTSRYKNSFFPDAIISWNNIITNFQNVPPFTSLISNSTQGQKHFRRSRPFRTSISFSIEGGFESSKKPQKTL